MALEVTLPAEVHAASLVVAHPALGRGTGVQLVQQACAAAAVAEEVERLAYARKRGRGKR